MAGFLPSPPQPQMQSLCFRGSLCRAIPRCMALAGCHLPGGSCKTGGNWDSSPPQCPVCLGWDVGLGGGWLIFQPGGTFPSWVLFEGMGGDGNVLVTLAGML